MEETIIDWWSLLSVWATKTDFSLNLSTELIGVALSIPLSVFIAYSLDKASDRRRRKRAMQSLVIESVEQLKFILGQHTDHLERSIKKGAPGVHINKLMDETAEIAEEAVLQSITTARSVYGERLNSDLRRALPQLAFHWKRLQKVLSLSDPFFSKERLKGMTFKN